MCFVQCNFVMPNLPFPRHNGDISLRIGGTDPIGQVTEKLTGPDKNALPQILIYCECIKMKSKY